MSHQEHNTIVHNKLNDQQLRKNLKSVMDTLKGNRKNLIAMWIGRLYVSKAGQ